MHIKQKELEFEPTIYLEEEDPNGLAPTDAGAKLDAGKPRPELVLGAFSRALMQVVNVGTFGANKYSDNGWLTVPKGIERYSDAQFRHHSIII